MPHAATTKDMIQQRGAYDPRDWWYFNEDFHGDAGDSLPAPWTVKDVSSAGTPTTDFVTDTENGVVQAKHDNTAEAQEVGYTWGDHLALNMSRLEWIEFRAKVNFTTSSGLGSADQRLVIGLGSNYAATLDNVTTNCWFRIEGANADLLIEGDDGTTDTNDEDSGLDLSDDTWTRFLIAPGESSDLSAVPLYVDNQGAGTIDLSSLSADTMVQPIAVLQRDGGSEQEDLQVDYVRFLQSRS